MQYVITQDGLAAAFAAESGGPKIKITEFRVGSAYGYTPVVADDALHGAILYSSPPTGYAVLDSNTCEFTLKIPQNIGTFDFGEIGLYLEDGTLFALQALPALQRKIQVPLIGANEIIMQARLRLVNLPSNIEIVVQTTTAGLIPETVSLLTLQSPIDSGLNAFIVHNTDEVGNTIWAVRRSDLIWDISTHKTSPVSGTVVTATQTSISAPEIENLSGLFPVGRYILRMLSGLHEGKMRFVSSVSGSGLTLLNGLPSSPAVGDAFDILQSDVSAIGTDFDELVLFHTEFRSNISIPPQTTSSGPSVPSTDQDEVIALIIALG